MLPHSARYRGSRQQGTLRAKSPENGGWNIITELSYAIGLGGQHCAVLRQDAEGRVFKHVRLNCLRIVTYTHRTLNPRGRTR